MTLLLFAVIGWGGLTVVEQGIKEQIRSKLQSTLNANVEALRIWIEEKRAHLENWAGQQQVRKTVLSLVHQASQKGWTAEELLASPELQTLRAILGSVTSRHGYIGFVVFDKTGFQAGALLDDPVGKRVLIHRSDFVRRSLQGETLVSLPFEGETSLPTPEGEWKEQWPTMFVSTPVRNETGSIEAVLAFRLRPKTDFTRILEVSRSGQSDETYAFDAQGLMISDSRFNNQLRRAGFIPDRPDSHAILNVQIRDPGQNAIRDPEFTLPLYRELPLTRMAQSAVSGKSGDDVDGYSDYRGIPVVGAWTWLPEYGFGVTTEMDVQEAFRPLVLLQRSFLTLFSLLGLSTALAVFLGLRQKRVEQGRAQAENALRENEKQLRLITDSLPVLISYVDREYRYRFNNQVYEKWFGVPPGSCFGKHLKDILGESGFHKIKPYFDAALSGEPVTYEETLALEKGGKRGFEATYVPDFDEDGNVRGLFTLVSDITRRKQTQAFVTVQNRVLEKIATGSSLEHTLDVLTGLVEEETDQMLCSILLLDPVEQCLRHCTAPRLPKSYILAIDGRPIGPPGGCCGIAVSKNETVIVEDIATDPLWDDFRDVALNHHLRACWSTPIRSLGGDILGTFALYYTQPRSPTEFELELIQSASSLAAIAIEQKRSEEALVQSEERYRNLVETMNDGLGVQDAEGNITFVNERFCTMVGYSRKELLGRPVSFLLDEVHRDTLKQQNQLRRQGRRQPYELTFLRKDGSLLPTLVSPQPLYDARNHYAGSFAVITDITERKRAEEDLKASHARYERLHAQMVSILQGTAVTTSRQFFRSLVFHLASAFQARYAVLAQIIDPPKKYARTLAIYSDGRFLDNQETSLEGTPCEIVLRHGRRQFYPDQVQALFPQATRLVDWGIESYFGIPLFDSSRNLMGVLAVLHDRPLHHLTQAEPILQAFATRAAAEMERQRAEDELNQHRMHLEKLIQKRTREMNRVNLALKESQRTISTLVSNLPGMAYRCLNDRAWTLQYVSEGCREITGYGVQDLLQNYKVSFGEEVIHPQDRDLVWEDVQAALKKKEPFQMVYRIIDAQGQVKWVWEQGRGVYSETGDVLALEGFITDVTERIRAEEKIKAALMEKEILLKEIHHRTKNNLQVVSSLLQLQSREIGDPFYSELFKESRNRIQSMALIHDKIFQSDNITQIDTEGYFRSLMSGLLRSYGCDLRRITVQIEVQGVRLDVETGIHCGLLVNELVSNSLKYAFPGNRKGFLRLSLRPLEKNRLELIVADNGIGLPRHLDFRNTESLGFQLITTVAEEQLEGAIELNRSRGTEFRIVFSMESMK